MKYPEYKFVNVAVNGVHNRNGIHDETKLGNPSGKEDTYATYFKYTDEMVEHYKENKSVKGFDGKAWSEYLPIDIDSSDLNEAQDFLQRLVQQFEGYGIDENSCRYYFSGKKGFHVMIPVGYFEAEPSVDIGKRFRKVALELAGDIKIDTAIYDKTRLLRLPNTRHTGSGLHKVELYPFEAMSLGIRDIQHKALLPVDELDIEEDYDVSQELSELYHGDLTKPTKETTKKTGAKAKICLETMMSETNLDGERNNIGIRVASHLSQSGLSHKMIWVALMEWNDNLDAPLESDEIEVIYNQSIVEEYGFGCKDQFLKNRCNVNCLFFKDDWLDADERRKIHAEVYDK